MTIIYLNKEHEEIQLFNEKFVKNNIENCFIVINGQKLQLCDYYYDCHKKNILIIQLVEKNIINDMSYMFYNCFALYCLPDISEWNKKTQ